MQLQNVIARAKREAIRLANFWISLVGLASITAIVWYFDPIEDLTARIALNLLAAVMSSLFFLEGISKAKRSSASRWLVLWFSVFSVLALLILFADRIDAPGLVINITSLLVACPSLFLYWKIVRCERLLLLWSIPVVITAMLSTLPLNAPADIILDLLLLPLPVVSCACVVWAFATSLALRVAREKRCSAIWGPGLQSLAMLLLVAPLVALTMLAVNELRVDDVWVAVSGALVGILFGGAVSQPFGKFLRALGGLSPRPECHEDSKTN